LSAAVHDPLWLLARQWQFGEFAGEDAGTPLAVRIEAEAVPITSWQPGDWTAAAPPAPGPLHGDYPLDVLIERETISAGEGLRLRAEAGAALQTALRDAGLDDAADAVAQNAPLTPDNDKSGPGWTALLPVLRGRCVDAKKVRTELVSVAAGTLPDWLDGPDRAAVSAVTRRWLQWYREDMTPANDETAWVGPRLEYRYSVGAGEFTLRAPEAATGSADWWSFDAEPHALSGDEPAEPETLTHRSVATPLRFPGMPADRFWEFEDAAIDIGALEADPHDLARLLVAECALVFGCDWLQVPLDVPSGSLVRIGTITYRTTFGERYRVPSMTSKKPMPDEPWRMYTVTAPAKAWDDRRTDAEFAAFDGLVVAPVSATRIEGAPIEEVVFVRDEAANLSWAVERIVPDAAGDPRLRSTARHDPPPEPEDRVADAELDYLLQTSVPEWWIPFLPRIANRNGKILLDLVRGAILKFGTGLPEDGLPVHAVGKFLNSDDQKVLFDAEVPREGVRVQRVPMLSRRSDGSYDLWTARRVSVGSGEGRSGLAFDSAIPRAAAPPH
jgi:hypothetical protein